MSLLGGQFTTCTSFFSSIYNYVGKTQVQSVVIRSNMVIVRSVRGKVFWFSYLSIIMTGRYTFTIIRPQSKWPIYLEPVLINFNCKLKCRFQDKSKTEEGNMYVAVIDKWNTCTTIRYKQEFTNMWLSVCPSCRCPVTSLAVKIITVKAAKSEKTKRFFQRPREGSDYTSQTCINSSLLRLFSLFSFFLSIWVFCFTP